MIRWEREIGIREEVEDRRGSTSKTKEEQTDDLSRYKATRKPKARPTEHWLARALQGIPVEPTGRSLRHISANEPPVGRTGAS